MKKYFIHNGTDQQGPFDIEDLKAKFVNRETSIWYEGLTDWTNADNIDELKGFLNTATPPPFGNKQPLNPPPLSKQEPKATHNPPEIEPYELERSNGLGKIITIIVVALIIVIGGIAILYNKGSDKGSKTESYEQKVMTVEEIERSQPTQFLNADGNYNENFWGTKFNVHGVIKNTATVATYKDAVVRITYYSKTKTKLDSQDYTIYETFPPHSSTKFELKIQNYKDVSTINWDVINATAN